MPYYICSGAKALTYIAKIIFITLDEGIMEVVLKSTNKTCLLTFVHQNGGLLTNLPSGMEFYTWDNSNAILNVDLEIIKNVNLNKQGCEKDEKSTYNLLECQLNKTFQVEDTINNYKIVFKTGTSGDPGDPR